MAYMLLRGHPKDPLDARQRELLRVYRGNRSSFATNALYFKDIEDRVRVYEALLSLGWSFWPFPTESVHSYKLVAIEELRRKTARDALPLRIVCWLLVVAGAAAALAGLLALLLPFGYPVLWFLLAALSAGLGGVKLAHLYHLRLLAEGRLIWMQYSFNLYEGTLPSSFNDTVKAVKAKLPDAHFEVESLDGGRYLLLTLPWRDRKYRLQEWHSNER